MASKQRWSFGDSLKQFDKFPETVSLNYDGGKKYFRSYSGLILTVVWIITIMGYAM